MTDLLPYALALAAGLLGLLFAPAVDRWVERFDRWWVTYGERTGGNPGPNGRRTVPRVVTGES